MKVGFNVFVVMLDFFFDVREFMVKLLMRF